MLWRIDLSNDNTSSATIALGNGGPAQGIVARVNLDGVQVFRSVLYSDANGHLVLNGHDGNIYSNGNLSPLAAGAFNSGTPAKPWAQVFTHAVNHVPTPSQSGVPLTTACTPTELNVVSPGSGHPNGEGQMCGTDGKWQTIAFAN